jgi:hypothetical protein
VPVTRRGGRFSPRAREVAGSQLSAVGLPAGSYGCSHDFGGRRRSLP